MHDRFRRFAQAVSHVAGSGPAFGLAVGIVIVWMVSGPLFGFSNTWQLAINTGTTIVTFLMVFVIQASQNREAKATQLKLDELISAVGAARNDLIGVEDAPEETVELHAEHFRRIVEQAQKHDPGVMDDVKVRPGRPRQPRRQPQH